MTTANLAAADRRFGSELLAQLLALYDVRRAAIYARGREKSDENGQTAGLAQDSARESASSESVAPAV